jgi:hypothetical protein
MRVRSGVFADDREFATDRLLSKATSTAELKTLLETEFKALTDIGNTYLL